MPTILITAGPTQEAIDPVRYLTNRSSGKMGYAVAQAAAKKGNHVILISGPTNIDIPDSVDFIPVETAEEMYTAVEYWIQKAELALFSAAVADYRMKEQHSQKIKKTEEELTLTLVKNKDILGSVRSEFNFKGTLVGFAAETENLIENARKKLLKKECDFVVANDVSQSGVGFDSDQNEVFLVFPDTEEPLGEHSKEHLGEMIVNRALDLHEQR